MKEIQEKVNDLIEVRKLFSLRDYAVSPSDTLAAYHFTDGTSELMSKWLDKVTSLHGREGVACALAGYRGVGKSHFLATFGAIAATPELRTKISDAHVAASAQGLLRRRYPIINVRRGTALTLVEEFRTAVAQVFGLDEGSLTGSVSDMLALAKEKAGEIPLIVLIDTAAERTSRVARDDGPVLGEIAEAAKGMSALVAVALDDDIAGADGMNSAIVRTYTIDYLDQEHLYKVVDSHLFPKKHQNRHVIKEVYEYFRSVMPSFRWSEHKFTALYPLHPVILEVAPFVRLFVQNFALLCFASEAGERILNRPANSLIALDEVFDNVEPGLRKIDDLRDAFAAYDRLNAEVVAKIPVLQRLQAKLVLKALLLLSLDGQGTTAADISAGMLIYDEKDTHKAYKTVDELVKKFAEALPDDVRVDAQEGRDVRYGLKVSSKDQLNVELDAAAANLDRSVIDAILHRLFHDRFTDSTFYSFDGTPKPAMDCQLTWRGGVRRGKVNWTVLPAESGDAELHDWEVQIDIDGSIPADGSLGDIPRVIWRPAELRRDETEAILRYHVLSTSNEIREKFGDMVRASLHSSSVVMARIVNRIFLDDGRLVIDDFDYNFTDSARNAPTLSELFSSMLEPLFEVRYPDHPYFTRRLGVGEVGSLVSDLFSGSNQRQPEVQQLAQTFGEPLGVVKLNEGIYVPEPEDKLSTLPSVEKILALLDGGRSTTLAAVYTELKKAPFGYVHEAQQIILAAMVSQRMIEFVTSKGDRISSRSLDLKIIWDDIVGIALVHEADAPTKELDEWAKLFVGEAAFTSLKDKASREAVQQGLAEWLGNWEKEAVLERFDKLHAETINTFVWKKATRTAKTVGAAASSIRSCVSGKITIEDCLSRLSDVFLEDTSNYKESLADLDLVGTFVGGHKKAAEIAHYASLAEYTKDVETENSREALNRALELFRSYPSEDNFRSVGYQWSKFHRLFSECFAAAHDGIMRSHQHQSRVEEVMRGEDWWQFQNLVTGRAEFNPETEMVFRLVEMSKDLGCKAETAEILDSQPFCECGFSISKAREWETIAETLESALANALNSLKAALMDNRSELIAEIAEKVSGEADPSLKQAAMELTASLGKGSFPVSFPADQLTLLRESLKAASQPDLGSFSAEDALDAVDDWFAKETADADATVGVN